MRSVLYTVTGGTDVLTVEERPLPEPGPGEVRVMVHRSGVNPTDWKSRRGAAPGAALEHPQVPNQDGAGEVDAVGPGVEAALLGLRVWIWEGAHDRPHGGTAQEYAVIPATHAITLPETASYDLGASLGVPFMTAHRCLTVGEDGPQRLGPGTLQGRTVLVAGGAGAVGNAAIQLARWSDATVITTVSSPEKATLARLAGADHVVDYTRQDVVAVVGGIAPHGADTIVEVAPAANAALDAQLVANGGCVAAYAGTPDDELTLPVRELMTRNARWQFVLLYTAPAGWRRRALEDIAAAVQDRAVGVGADHGLPLHHFSLADTAKAHAAVEGGAVGKVLIDVIE
ncbi:NADPH:quinone reductase [Nocardioides terrisoli]|uniref:NADPH:quinone reductase n=1 Tax=Nocardioides terrisoli TaxID=3388267 RepID=UPI00287BB494|nr:NADPH:quinone reductase [Nocardioides marmorisolisilvae]